MKVVEKADATGTLAEYAAEIASGAVIVTAAVTRGCPGTHRKCRLGNCIAQHQSRVSRTDRALAYTGSGGRWDFERRHARTI